MEYPAGTAVRSADSGYERVHRILDEEFHAAIARRDAASARFDDVRRTALSNAERTYRIADAFREYSAALSALSRAALRVTDFEASGVVPEDLKGTDCPSFLPGPVT